ncbi:hypothetical protein ES705_30208 [subsurface metagenome]
MENRKTSGVTSSGSQRNPGNLSLQPSGIPEGKRSRIIRKPQEPDSFRLPETAPDLPRAVAVFTCWRATGASFLPVSFKLNPALARKDSSRKHLTQTIERKTLKPMLRFGLDSAQEQSLWFLLRSAVLLYVLALVVEALKLILRLARSPEFIATVQDLIHDLRFSWKPFADKDKT